MSLSLDSICPQTTLPLPGRQLCRRKTRAFIGVNYRSLLYPAWRPSNAPTRVLYHANGSRRCDRAYPSHFVCDTAAAFRAPPMLTKITSTLDHISHGHLTLDLGTGRKPANTMHMGIGIPRIGSAWSSLWKPLQVLKAMVTQKEPSFQGRYFSIHNASNNPRPVQKPHPPLMLGGSGSGLLKIAAAEADILNINPPIFTGKDYPNDPAMALEFDLPSLKKRLSILYMEECGRNPKEMERGDGNPPQPGSCRSRVRPHRDLSLLPHCGHGAQATSDADGYL